MKNEVLEELTGKSKDLLWALPQMVIDGNGKMSVVATTKTGVQLETISGAQVLQLVAGARTLAEEISTALAEYPRRRVGTNGDSE